MGNTESFRRVTGQTWEHAGPASVQKPSPDVELNKQTRRNERGHLTLLPAGYCHLSMIGSMYGRRLEEYTNPPSLLLLLASSIVVSYRLHCG